MEIADLLDDQLVVIEPGTEANLHAQWFVEGAPFGKGLLLHCTPELLHSSPAPEPPLAMGVRVIRIESSQGRYDADSRSTIWTAPPEVVLCQRRDESRAPKYERQP